MRPSDLGQTMHELQQNGFMILPEAVPVERLPALAAAYDRAMLAGSGPDFSVGRTTTRLYDLVNRGPEFDEVYVQLPLLQACHLLLGGPFKLSSLMARTVRPQADAQELHVDLARASEDRPMIGFILMLDEFRLDNGATRFVPGSHRWTDVPARNLQDRRDSYPGEQVAVGAAGSLIVFDGSVWHGHTANRSSAARRSIQGSFVRRAARSAMDWSERMQPETLARIGPLARELLSLEPGEELGRNRGFG